VHPSPPPPPPSNPINHIIFLAEENRSFDHYFGKLNDSRSAPPFNLPREVNGLPDNCGSSNSDWNVSCGAMNTSPNASGAPTTPIYAFHLKDRMH
jgi:phospholipase C